MTWPAWQKGSLPTGTNLEDFPSPLWLPLVEPLLPLRRPLTVISPCLGLDTAGHALRGLGAQWVTTGCDTDKALAAPLQWLYGPGFQGHQIVLGTAGNILHHDISTWPVADLIISGPPCPPWSTIGTSRGRGDDREAVFAKVTELLVNQGQRGAAAFVIEMVPGMLHVPAGRAQSPWQEWIAHLSSQCPHWDIRAWHMNSSWFVPQERARIYTVAYNRLRTAASLPPAPTSSDTSSGPLPLASALNLHLPPVREQPLTFQQQANLQGHKESSTLQRAGARLLDNDLSFPRIATIALDRDMGAAFGDGWVRTDGLCATLRTGNELMWLLSGEPQAPWMSRCLHPLERAYLQGLPPATLAGLSKHDMLRFTGNAMTVPVVAAVLARLLNGLPPDAGLHERWSWAEEQQALTAARATKLQQIQALCEVHRQAQSEISWSQARAPLRWLVLAPYTKQVRLRSSSREGVPHAARPCCSGHPRWRGYSTLSSGSTSSWTWIDGDGSSPARRACCFAWHPARHSPTSSDPGRRDQNIVTLQEGRCQPWRGAR